MPSSEDFVRAKGILTDAQIEELLDPVALAGLDVESYR